MRNTLRIGTLALGCVALSAMLPANKVYSPAVSASESVQWGMFRGQQQLAWREVSPSEELRRILRTHIFTGRPITRSVREAAGAGTTLLRDERVYGEPAKCSFVTYRKKRALVCDPL